MPRSRTIKPGFFENDALAALDPLARLLFAGMWCWADRNGRLEYRPKKLKGYILRFDDCDIEALCDQLERAGFIKRYFYGDRAFVQVVNFTSHQKPHPKEPSVFPDEPDLGSAEPETFTAEPGKGSAQPDLGANEPCTIALTLLPSNLLTLSPSLEDSGVSQKPSPKFVPPTVEDVRAYCSERKNAVDPETFVDHYTANGWKIGGRGAMKDWRAAVRTWEKNSFGGGRGKQASNVGSGSRIRAPAGKYANVRTIVCGEATPPGAASEAIPSECEPKHSRDGPGVEGANPFAG